MRAACRKEACALAGKNTGVQMILIRRDVLECQARREQPPWWMLVGIYALGWYGLPLAWYLAGIVWSGQTEWALEHNVLLRRTWFSLDTALKAVLAAFLLRRYADALFAGFRFSLRNIARLLATGIILGLPLVVYVLWPLALVDRNLAIMARENPDGLRLLHERVWAPLGYGSDVFGVLLASALCLVIGPFSEELLITGYAFNKASRRVPLAGAVLLCAALFAVLHLPITGPSAQLVKLFVMGCAAILARLVSGTWMAGLAVHILSNVAILVPRWMVAIMWFRVQGKV